MTTMLEQGRPDASQPEAASLGRFDAGFAAPTGVRIADNILRRLVEDMWFAYIDPEDTDPLVATDTPGGTDLTAWVSMTGAWDGHLVVSCSQPAGVELAGAMLQLDLPQVSDEDVSDAVGELANVLAGNVKALLPPLTGLSTPHVSTGRVWFPGTRPVSQLHATWRGQPVAVSVLHLTLD